MGHDFYQTIIQYFSINRIKFIKRITKDSSNSSLLWAVYTEKNSYPTFFLKQLNLSKMEVDTIGSLINQLILSGLPLAKWERLISGPGYCIEIGKNLSVVVEQALMGHPLTNENCKNQPIFKQVAITLAKIHNELSFVDINQSNIALSHFTKSVEQSYQFFDYIRNNVFMKGNKTIGQSLIKKWFSTHQNILSQQLFILEKEFASFVKETNNQIILGDCNYTNILFYNNYLSGIVDYEDIHVGPCEVDILSFCMYRRNKIYFPSILKEFLSIYHLYSARKINKHRLFLVARIIIYKRIFKYLAKAFNQINHEKITAILKDIDELLEIDEKLNSSQTEFC